jgi:dTDP-4-dehydrorhamnose 3,5-epimerase-like enzyme
MEQIPAIIKGESYTDHRGTLHFVNDFAMDQVKRFYIIEHKDTEIIRAWRAHRIEQRWFHVIKGVFLIRLVKIDNWESPDRGLPVLEITLSASSTEILHIPVGFASSIQATETNSSLLIFADYGIENSKTDNYLYPADYFKL